MKERTNEPMPKGRNKEINKETTTGRKKYINNDRKK